MKILQINTFSNGSTGKIMFDIHSYLCANNVNSYVAWGRGKDIESSNEFSINDNIGIKIHGIYTRLLDRHGFASWNATYKLINFITEIKPDIIHIHNLHGYYINIKMLFDFLKKYNKPVVWTLHDCWAFTGHCAHFELENCYKWEKGCYECTQKKTYPKSILFDNSKKNWKDKKNIFSYKKLHIVCPSKWIFEYCKKSILKNCQLSVIHNGIDCSIFKNYSENNEILYQYGINNKPVILGVAGEWTEKKGLYDFYKMAELATDYNVVMVGLNKKQLKNMPANVIGIKKTNNQIELAKLYSASYVLFNPTYEDNYPTVNLEAQACGTPVVSYETGGGIESVPCENIIRKGDVQGAYEKIKQGKLNLSDVSFDKNNMASEYFKLYKEIYEEKST